MTRVNQTVLRTLLVLLLAAPAAAQFGSGSSGDAGKASISLVWQEAPAAGRTAMLGVIVDIARRWHIQAGEGSGDEQPAYVATTLALDLPEGWTAGATQWPPAHTFELGVGTYAEKLAGYRGRVLLAVPIEIPAGAAPGPHQIAAVLGYQACDDSVCIMPTQVSADSRVTLGTTGAGGADAEALFAATLGSSPDDAPGAPHTAIPTAPPPATGRGRGVTGLTGGLGLPGTRGEASVTGAAGFGPGRRVQAEIAWYEDRLEPGMTARLGLIIDVEPAWHIQAGTDVPPEVSATTVELKMPDDWRVAGPIIWPDGHEFTLGEGDTAVRGVGYEGRVLVVVPVEIAADAKPGEETVVAKIGYQACDDRVCERPTEHIAIGDATVVAAGAPVVPRPRDQAVLRLFDDALGAADPARETAAAPGGPSVAVSGGLLGFVLLALLGGFLLNLTPCVLPVIPLKIMSLAHTAGNRRRTLLLGVVMSLGVIAFWMGLGLAIASISGFTSANQLFQYPPFAIGVGIVIAILAVGMCGLFSVRLPQWVYRISPSQESVAGSFGFGIMTAVLSTPCTAPFMGAAAVAAVGQSMAIVLTVFGAIGAGMASPYLVLSAFPQLVDRMPRTGPASELIKQIMGLLMLAAAAYFVGVGISGLVVEPPAPPSRAYWWPVFAFAAAAAGWLAHRTIRITPSAARRLVFCGLGVAGVVASLFGAVRLTRPDKTIEWVYYTPDAFDQALADGDAVVLEFTAEWCLNCKLLERSVLNSSDVAGRLARSDVVPMKVDLTGNNTAGNRKLKESGSVTIPWLVVYTPGGKPVFAQNWYTPEMLLDGIDEALGTTVARK